VIHRLLGLSELSLSRPVLEHVDEWIDVVGGRAAVDSKWESDDVTLTRCSEDDVGQSDNADGVLRGLGSMLRTRPYWAHEQLEPFFTERRER
jgi:hypothetical protein